MAKAASRSTANTKLYVGTLKAEIGLFTTKADPAKASKFDTAGPNGGTLKVEMRAAPVPVGAEPVQETEGPSDPLAATHEEHAAPRFERELGATQGANFPPAAAPRTMVVDGEFRQVLVEEGSGEVVESHEVRRGVRREDGSFVDCTEQIAAIEERTKLDRIDVIRCVDGTRIRRERVIGSYYVGAQDTEAKGVLKLLYDALRERREVAIVKYTTRSRQQLGVIMPHPTSGTLVLLNLVWAEDWRDAPAKATAIQKVGVRPQQVMVMCQILAALHGHVDDLDAQRDDAIRLREELHARALAGEMDTQVVEPLPVAEEEPSLEDALAASLAAVRAGKV